MTSGSRDSGRREKPVRADDWAALKAMQQSDIGRGATPFPHCNHRRQRPVRPGLTQCVVCALLTVTPSVPATVGAS